MRTRESGLNIGDRVGDGFEVVAAVPHASRPGIWAVGGHRDGTYVSFTASTVDGVVADLSDEDDFYYITDALSDMLARARL